MKWMLIRAVACCLAVGCLSSLAPAAIIEHHLVLDPTLGHNTGDASGVYNVSSGIKVDLPTFTLDPGDTLRVTVELAGGKSLKMVPIPADAHQFASAQATIQQRSFGGWPGAGVDSTDTVRIYNAQLQPIVDQTVPSSYWIDPTAEELHIASAQFAHSTDLGESMNFTFRQWLFELEMPTTIIDTGGVGETFPYRTTTFDGNYFSLSFYSTRFGQPFSFTEAVFVVPEPGSLGLAGLALIACISRRAVRAGS
jgi:hypothetical protein